MTSRTPPHETNIEERSSSDQAARARQSTIRAQRWRRARDFRAMYEHRLPGMSIPLADWDRLTALSERSGCTRTELIRQAVCGLAREHSRSDALAAALEENSRLKRQLHELRHAVALAMATAVDEAA